MPFTENSGDASLSQLHSNQLFKESKISFRSLSKLCTPSLGSSSMQNSYCQLGGPETPKPEIPHEDENKRSEALITAWRRAIIDDTPAIKKLQTLTGNIANVLFRKKNIKELIEQSYFAVVQLNSKGDLVSFTAYNSYPNVSSVTLYWTEWLKTHYKIKDVSARNVLFIHYMVWEPERENEFLRLLLETSFSEFIHLKHIIIVKPPKAQIPNFYEQYFIPILPLGLEEYGYDSVQSLLVCLRTTILRPFIIRTAFEGEVNKIKAAFSCISNEQEEKDSAASLEKNLKGLKNEDKKILVCEKNGCLVGVMVLNFTIDLDALNKEYELVPFNRLKKASTQEQIYEEKFLASLQTSSSKNKDHPNIFKSSEFLFNQLNWEVSVKDISTVRSRSPSQDTSSSFSSDSDFLQFSSYNSLIADTNSCRSNFDLSTTLSLTTPENSSKTDNRVTYHPSLNRASHFFSPLQYGPSNCFMIDFLAADVPEVDEKLVSLDFLKAAFRTTGDKDYCLLIIPSWLLPNQLQDFFVRVPSKQLTTNKLELYICHKHSLVDTLIHVRITEAEDLTSVNDFLKNVNDGDTIYQDISTTCFSGNNAYKSFLLLAESKIIGVSVIDCRDYQDILNAFFDVGNYNPKSKVYETQSLLKHLITNPAYGCHIRFFMYQIMKLSSLNCLYYAYSFANKGYCSLMTALEELVPVQPRKKVLYDTTHLIMDERKGCLPPFSLHFLTDKSCDINKLHLNIVIVVVGASRTALSFLEHLIFGNTKMNVQYNNLICVTPHEVESFHNGSPEMEDVTDNMFPIRDDFSKNYLFMLSLKAYVSFIYGVMTAINRSEKYITVNNKITVKYDYLILTCGVQYLTPVPKAKKLPKQTCQRNYMGTLARFLNVTQKKKLTYCNHPNNMFLINTSSDAKYSLRVLQNLINKMKKTEKKIIIYGHNIHVFLTIHTLIKLGVPGEVIAFVEPLLQNEKKVTIFNDFSVDQAVLTSLKTSKINYYTSYYLYDWTINAEDNRITSIIFHSNTNKLVIPCLAFFPFTERLVSEVTYKAVCEAGLVYDGRLVIDHNFRTNDKYIYAAGSFTKYARRYFADDKDHIHFNSREVGQMLAQIVRGKVDPLVIDITKKESSLVPELKEPVMYYCQLPGDFNLFVMRKPGIELDLETAYNLRDYGEVLYTGDCQMKQGFGYFRLHLSPEGFVESITCYTKDKIDYVNLYYLYGLHEKLLNNLLCRYDLSLIPDLFDYFRQPWARALFHENFKILRKFNTKSLKQKLVDGTSFIDKVVEDLKSNNWESIDATFLNEPFSNAKQLNRKCSTEAKLKRFKPPLVPYTDFPSRVSLINEESLEEDGENEKGIIDEDPDDKKSPLTYWRIAHFSDADNIQSLIDNSNFVMNDLFGEPDILTLIELSNFSVVQFNSKKELVSFISLFCYPDIPAVPSFEWYHWLQTNYKLNDVTPRNTFFIHYMIWKTEYYYDFLKLALETVFLENAFCRVILVMKPPKVKLPRIFSEYFVQVLPKDAQTYNCDGNSLQTALVCLRSSLMERLIIRLAIVEDHDDLMPIAEQHNERLRELYGDFCMAEIIQYPGTPNRKTLVCEFKGYAVGFMTLNTEIDYELLNSQFDLSLFHGLRKRTEDDTMAEDLDRNKGTPILMPDKIDPFMQVVDSKTLLQFLARKPSLCASITDSSESENSNDVFPMYNEISHNLTNYIFETLNLKLVPKFSAHALSSVKDSSEGEKSLHSDSDSQICFSIFEKVESEGEQTDLKSESSVLSLQNFNLPIYHGAPNAFYIEFFAMDENFDDRLCQDFLEAAFELFNDLEYCIITLPTDSPTFPLLEFFTRVTPRPLKRFRQELYVCHKSSAFVHYMRVRRTLKPDLEEIQVLLKGIDNNELIFADIVNSCYFEDSAFQSFVLVCSESIIGVAVLCNESGLEYLAHHYQVSDFINFEHHRIEYHAILKHLVLSPIFHAHSRFFLRDLMRIADITCLYRCLYEELESNRGRFSLMTILGNFIPVKPRRMVQYYEPSLGPNVPPTYFLTPDEPFSLYHMNPRLCSLKKTSCNKNIVIVGASKTAYSFLETLLFGPSALSVTYNNITMVSPHGMGTELPSHTARDFMFPFRGKYSRFYKMQLSLKTYVNLIYGVMTQINRVNKYIVINNEAIVPYDYLILLCGRQFAMPVPSSMVNNTPECKRHNRPRSSLFKYIFHELPEEKESENVYPSNAFIVNTIVDGTNALISLQYLLQKRKQFPTDEKIIIYGHNIFAYLCIQSLLKYGIPPNLIALVEPFPMGTFSISCFEDDNIDKAVIKNLADFGIDHYKGFVLYDWTLCNGQIQTAIFHSKHTKITIRCLAMFPYEKKIVSKVTFKAVNEASLVYDGKLVINNNFQTNDPYIYAAGGLTKYQRKYYAKDKCHRNYSSDEVGRHLGDILRMEVDPTIEENKTVSEVVPEMTEPIVLYGVLPGDWYYFRVKKPGPRVDEETRATVKEYGETLITGDCEMSQGRSYFKLMLDDYGFVSGIICYSKEPIDVKNLEVLYGKHEKLLNNLVLRFDLGMIEDFYSYFREPWVYAIFHDCFHMLLAKNMEAFHNESFGSREGILDSVINTLKENNWQRPPKEKLEEIKKRFDESSIKAEIVSNIMDFLTYFDEPFPMYATPRILRVLLHDASTSYLHKIPVTSTRPIIKITNTASEKDIIGVKRKIPKIAKMKKNTFNSEIRRSELSVPLSINHGPR